MRSPIKLEFSEKYDKDHAREYFLKHQDGLARRLSRQRPGFAQGAGMGSGRHRCAPPESARRSLAPVARLCSRVPLA